MDQEATLRDRWEDAAPRERSEFIIHGAAAAAGAAAALSVVPGSDSVAIMPIQVAMIAGIAQQYGIEPSSSLVKSTLWASLGSVTGKAGAGLLLRWTPGAGNVIRAGVAAGVTEAIGRMVLKRLKDGEGLT